MIVLSGAEKYARAQAQFEPVVEKLSGLSTVAFHQEMNKRAVGTTGLVLHSYCLNRLKQFYVLKAKTRCYIEDIK
ncbi:hypothetical protein PC111_g8328 [Phytophthora cactorum]|nr:hypothetical protein PC111_g8328 [Phytophthora cactorum]